MHALTFEKKETILPAHKERLVSYEIGCFSQKDYLSVYTTTTTCMETSYTLLLLSLIRIVQCV